MNGCIIVPYRDRAEHLKKFVHHYRKVIPELPIYVIEQGDDKLFNRAKLFNVGVLECDYDYYVFHDVDMLIEKRSDPYYAYGPPECVIHSGTLLDRFGYKWPKDFFGGVNVISRRTLIEVNGWTNLIWGWGNEEEMLQDDFLEKGYEIKRRYVYYKCLPHKRPISMDVLNVSAEIRRKGKDNSIDGLTHCEYDVVDVRDENGYKLIKVML